MEACLAPFNILSLLIIINLVAWCDNVLSLQMSMHSDRNAKEPGSMVWQSEHILMCSDGTLSQSIHRPLAVIL